METTIHPHVFDTCQKINNLIEEENHNEARNELIKLLHYHEVEEIEYSPLVNFFIRQTGLYPYIKPEQAFRISSAPMLSNLA